MQVLMNSLWVTIGYLVPGKKIEMENSFATAEQQLALVIG